MRTPTAPLPDNSVADPNPLCDICHRPTDGTYRLQDCGRVIGVLIVCGRCAKKAKR